MPAIEGMLRDGALAAARDLHGEVLAACGGSIETRRCGDALDLCAEAARAVGAGDFTGARAALGRLRILLPDAPWAEAAEKALAGVVEGLGALRAGPLAGPGPIVAGAPSPFVSALLGARPAAPPAAPRPEGDARPGRFLLWVDGVGSYLVLRSERVTIGRAGSSARPDLPVAADVSGVQAEILRVDEDYFLAAHGAVDVNGRRVEKKLLESGDRIRLASKCEIVFRLPTALSTTAVLELPASQRIAGDAREVILLDRSLLIGREDGCHVRAGEAGSRIVLVAGPEGIVARSDDGVLVDGAPAGKEAPVRPGTQMQVGEVTFTVTPVEGERS
jgi:hypothetical protein